MGFWQVYGDGIMVAHLLVVVEVRERGWSCQRNECRAKNSLSIYTTSRMRIPSVPTIRQPGPYATLTSKSFESRKGSGPQRFRTRVAQDNVTYLVGFVTSLRSGAVMAVV